MSYQIKELKKIKCPYEKTIKLVGDKWSLTIIKELRLKENPLRFNEIVKSLSPLSAKTLTIKLKKLIAYEIIKKEPLQVKPDMFTYELSEKGKELIPVIDGMANWSRKWHQ